MGRVVKAGAAASTFFGILALALPYVSDMSREVGLWIVSVCSTGLVWCAIVTINEVRPSRWLDALSGWKGLILAPLVLLFHALWSLTPPPGRSEAHAQQAVKLQPTPTVEMEQFIARMRGFSEGRTDAEAQRLIAPYIGTAVFAVGRVHNVWIDDPPMVALERSVNDVVILVFAKAQGLDRLSVGDDVRARCVFKGKVDRMAISLRDCKLI